MTKKLYIIGLVKSRKNWKHWKKTFELFYCATIKMNCKEEQVKTALLEQLNKKLINYVKN